MVDYPYFSAFVRQRLALLGIASLLWVGSDFLGGAIATAEALETRQSQPSLQETETYQELNQDLGEGGSSQTRNILSFPTDRYSARVYQQNGQFFMDVYDRQSQRYLLRRSSAVLNSPPNAFWTTYRSVQGNLEVYIRNDQNRNAELEILTGGQSSYIGRGSVGPENPSNNPGNGTPDVSSTLLAFNTNEYRTRVYRRNNQVFMDVADVRTNTFLLRQAPTAIAPQQQTSVTSRTYAATQGPYQAFASVSSNRATELQLWSNGGQIYRASGFNASGSDLRFNNSPSTGFMGNDFSVPTQARIATRSANLRDRPSTTSSTVVATLLQCTPVTATRKQYNADDRYVWYLIDVRGQARGWIRGDLVNTEFTSC